MAEPHVEAAGAGFGEQNSHSKDESKDNSSDDATTDSAQTSAALAFGPAPQGALFKAVDNHVMDRAHHAPTWVNTETVYRDALRLCHRVLVLSVGSTDAEISSQTSAAIIFIPAQQVVI